MIKKFISLIAAIPFCIGIFAATKHGATSAHTTINGKILCGYQGWFAAQNDGSNQKWKHYSTSTQRLGQVFEPGACSIDMWPDMREYHTDEQYETAFTNPDGSKATVFSSYKMNTSRLHFRWMEEYGIDGAILQRFVTNIRSSGSLRNFNDTVMVHTVKAAKEYNRAVCIMYDMTSMKTADKESVKEDWKRLVDNYKITSGGDDQPYLYHKGKPLVCLWGVGFNDGRHDPESSSGYSMEAIRELVTFFKEDPEYGGCTVLLGVNYTWRTNTGKDFIDDYLFDIIRMADMINPWLVGRLKSVNDMNSFSKQVEADLLWCKNNNVEYMPCAFPGFSWLNMAFRDSSKSTNIISRDNGKFLWRQFETSISKGVDQVYATMFDEIDEGTALFKVSNTPPNNIDGNNEPNTTRVGEYPASVFQTLEGLPSDYYLWMVGEAARMLRKEISVTQSIPVRSDRFSLGDAKLSCESLSDGKFRISYTGTVDRKLFCSKPYVVAYGAPSYGKEIDSRYFGTELTTDGVIVEGTPGQIVTVILTDDTNKAMGAGSISLPDPGSGISRLENNLFEAYYDSTGHHLIINSYSELIQSGTVSVYSTNGSEMLSRKIVLENFNARIPLNLNEGIYLIRFSALSGSFSQKIIVSKRG